MTGKRLVPVGDEIDLCAQYLDVMSQRYEAEYQIDVTNNAARIMVPPGILHALVENAISHWAGIPKTAVFRIGLEGGPDAFKIQLWAPATQTPVPSAMSSGTGNAYIEARLREAFGDHWRMHAEYCSSGWQTIIEVA